MHPKWGGKTLDLTEFQYCMVKPVFVNYIAIYDCDRTPLSYEEQKLLTNEEFEDGWQFSKQMRPERNRIKLEQKMEGLFSQNKYVHRFPYPEFEFLDSLYQSQHLVKDENIPQRK